jgi:Contractile injection system tape measure protein
MPPEEVALLRVTHASPQPRGECGHDAGTERTCASDDRSEPPGNVGGPDGERRDAPEPGVHFKRGAAGQAVGGSSPDRGTGPLGSAPLAVSSHEAAATREGRSRVARPGVDRFYPSRTAAEAAPGPLAGTITKGEGAAEDDFPRVASPASDRPGAGDAAAVVGGKERSATIGRGGDARHAGLTSNQIDLPALVVRAGSRDAAHGLPTVLPEGSRSGPAPPARGDSGQVGASDRGAEGRPRDARGRGAGAERQTAGRTGVAGRDPYGNEVSGRNVAVRDAADGLEGAELLAIWRGDRAAFRRAVDGRSANDLLRLVEAIVTRPGANAPPPLVEAARSAAAGFRAPATLLRAVLECILEDRPIDLAALSAGVDAHTAEPTMADTKISAVLANSGGVDWAALAAVLDGTRAGAESAETISAAVSGDPWRVADMLTACGNTAARAARFVAASRIDDRVRLLQAVRPGYAERELPALEVIWAASPEATRAGDMWRFAVMDALAAPVGGGVAGLTRRTVAFLGGSGTGLARELLWRVEAAPRRGAAAAVAQIASALRALAEDERSAGAEAEGPRVVRAAGLVLIAPFLPMLFERLELTVRGAFRGRDAADRAVGVLNAVAYGDRPDPADGRPLERLICGVPWDRRLPPHVPLDKIEARLLDELLTSVIERWTAIGRTSVAGFREAFLQREGILRGIEGGWLLEVQPRAFDMLLDRLPWSIAVLKLAWMSAPIHVKWRI